LLTDYTGKGIKQYNLLFFVKMFRLILGNLLYVFDIKRWDSVSWIYKEKPYKTIHKKKSTVKRIKQKLLKPAYFMA